MRAGHRVAAVKVTGTGAFGDFNAYVDAGAHFVADFVDTGMATTYRQPLPRIVAATDTLLADAARDGQLAMVDTWISHLEEMSASDRISYAQRVEEAGLQDRVELLLKDYRDLDGSYDKLVSIEMIEAVGHEYMDTYFDQCARLLREDGMMLMQAITIADQRYKAALKSVDFIQRYIFPGGFLPSPTAILQSVTQSSDMRIYHLEDIGAHYAETLKRWREAFASNLNRIWSTLLSTKSIVCSLYKASENYL